MNATNYADRLHAHIMSNDLPAFQKMLCEIAKDAAFMRKVLAYNAMDLDNNRYTLIQSATVQAINTGQADMLLALINAGAKIDWATSLQRPVLRRQNAYYRSAEYFAYSDEMELDEAYIDGMEVCDDCVADMDSVDDCFERALKEGNPYAEGIINKLQALGCHQLKNTVQGLAPEVNLGFMTQVVYQFIGSNVTSLVQMTTEPNKPESLEKKSPEQDSAVKPRW